MLNGKVVVITGAKGGLGTYVTNAFLAAGARVCGVSRSISATDFPDERFSAYAAELSNPEAAAGLVSRVLAGAGRIDALVHLMGGFAGGKRVDEADGAELDRMLDLNLRSAYHLFAAAIPAMRSAGKGAILAIGSRSAVEPSPMSAAYAASKAALVSLVRSIAVENKAHGISANILLPGTMDTPANRAAMPGAEFGAWVDPNQVASLLVHLASDGASNVNGAVIPVLGRGV